jgi:hypothetical protein
MEHRTTIWRAEFNIALFCPIKPEIDQVRVL